MLLEVTLAAAALTAPCEGIVGAQALLARPEARIVMVGEVHGTAEAPAIVGSLLCEARKTGPAILALEAAPTDGQAEIDRYLASAGTSADREALRAAPMWADRHARASVAVLELVETARRLKAPVALFDTTPARSGPTDGPREQGMAHGLVKAAQAGRVIVLTGLGHADRTSFTSVPVPSAIRWLPPGSVVSLAPMVSGGEAWGCRAATPGAASECKAQALPVRRLISPRAVTLDPGLREGFDGGYSVGRPFSASPPARGTAELDGG
jgi:hypothetical protein